MKIVDWNVRYQNKKVRNGLEYIFAYKPDIICLQEFPETALKLLETIPQEKYQICITEDALFRVGANPLLVTMVSKGYASHELMDYPGGSRKSLLQAFLYNRVYKIVENHKATITRIKASNSHTQIINVHFSAGINILDRMNQIKYLFNKIDLTIPTIICGDFNTSDNKIFNLLTGWARGYTKHDYKIRERKEVQKIFDLHLLENIFSKVSTTVNIKNVPLIQFDHILLSSHFKLKSKKRNRRHGSDHHILFTEIETGFEAEKC